MWNTLIRRMEKDTKIFQRAWTRPQGMLATGCCQIWGNVMQLQLRHYGQVEIVQSVGKAAHGKMPGSKWGRDETVLWYLSVGIWDSRQWSGTWGRDSSTPSLGSSLVQEKQNKAKKTPQNYTNCKTKDRKTELNLGSDSTERNWARRKLWTRIKADTVSWNLDPATAES